LKISLRSFWQYRSFRFSTYFAGGLVASVVLIFVLLQTALVQKHFARILSQSLSDDDFQLKMSPISGLIPFNIQFATLTLADKNGVWLELNEARFQWSFLALLTGEIQIEQLSARRLHVLRLPPSQPEAEKNEPLKIPNSLPDLNFELPVINIQQVAIDEISLEKRVLGQKIALNLSAKANTVGQTIYAQGHLKRTDQNSLKFNFNSEIHLKPLRVALNLNVNETGGLLAALSQQPALKDLNLELKAQGLLTDWQANLNLHVGGIGNLNTQINLGITEQPWLNLHAQTELKTGLLEQKLLNVIGAKQNLNLQLFAPDSENIQIKSLRFNNALLSLDSQLKFNLPTQEIDSEMVLKVAQLNPLNELLGMKLLGRSELNASVSGSIEKPKLVLKLNIDDLKVNDLQITHLENTLELEPLKTLKMGEFKLTLNGLVENLKQQAKALPESNLNWQALAILDANQRLDLKNFQLDGAWSHLKLAGVFDIPQQQGDLDLHLKLDSLKPLTNAVEANINTTAKIKIYPKIEKIEIALKSDIQKLSGLAPPVNALLGQKISLTSQIEIQPEKSFSIKQLHLNAKAISVNASTELNLDTQQLVGNIGVNIPKFSHKDLKLQRANAEIKISGTTTQPNINANISLAKLEAAQQQIKSLSLKVSAEDVIDNLKGVLELGFQQYQQKIALKTVYALKKQQLRLEKLLFTAPKTQLKGRLAINLASTLIEGKISLNSDLNGLKAWTQQDLKGQLNLTADFKPRQQQQFLQLNTQINQLNLADLHIKNISLKAQINNLLKKPKLNITLSLKQLKQQQTEVNKLTLDANGLLEKLNLKLAVQGQHQHPFAVNLLALLKYNDKQTQLALQKITGSLAKQKIKLAKTSIITLSAKKFSLSPLNLAIGKARLQGKLDYSTKTLAGQINLALPLSVLNQFAEIPVTGDVNMQLNFSGSAKKPVINLASVVSELTLKHPDFKKFPATKVALNAGLKLSQLHAQVTIENPQFKQPIQLELQTPVGLQLEPFVFTFSEKNAMQGKLSAMLDLAQTSKNLPLKGQQIKGDFNANLQLAGSLKQPVLNGQVSLKQGEYQNSLTETYFKAIQLQLEANPEKISLKKLSLKDTNGGDLNAFGSLSLNAQQQHPFTASVKINHLQLANSPQLKTHLSGNLAVNGNQKQALLKGSLDIDDFRFNLPSGSSQAEIPEMEVIEIGKDFPSLNAQLKAKKGRPKQDLKLNLEIGVKIAQQFFINGHGLDSEWQGDLTIKGAANSPHILGQIKTKRGSLEVLNNRFVFKHGVIDFNGAFPPIPSLDIKTVAETDDGEATIHITGMAKKPQLTLSNNPSLPQDEILSNLLFGQEKQSISPMQAIQLADAVSMIATGGLGSLNALGDVRSGLGLDRLSVGGDDFDTAAVKAGKYVSESIYIEVEQGLGSESSTATVEIDLFPDIKAEIEFDQQSDSAVGIKWKHDY